MQEFMALDRNLKLRTLTVFLTALLNAAVLPNMTIYYSHYFGAATAGILLIVVSIASFIAGLYGGHLSDVHGRKPIMLAGSILLIIGYLIAALVNSPLMTNPVLAFVGFLLARVGGSLSDPAEQAMMIDVSTPQNRRFVYAMLYWVINISVMLGAAIGGWFFRDYLFELLLAMAVIAVININIINFGMRETFQSQRAVSGSVWQAVKAYGQVFADKRYVLFLAGSLLASIVTNQPNFYLAVHLGRDFNATHLFGIALYGQRMLSVVTIINTVMIIILMALFTRLTAKWALGVAFAVGVGLQTVGFALSFEVNNFWPLALAAVILTVGEMIAVPSSQTLRAALMDEQKIGAYSGGWAAVNPLASTLSGVSVSVSPLLGNSGMAALMLVLGAGGIALVARSARGVQA
ncbi:MFS transporter [Lacticaseibacillus sp. N501-2]|uniref:MFS transporter n=1 Tax=Lacticaseibacillus salsurae TaxID=3367729 RepID=UPI0038B293F9